VRTIEALVDLYFQSVGRNSKLLLNVPPTADGLLHPVDVARLTGCHDRLRALFASDHAFARRVKWQRTGDRTATAEVDLGKTVTASIVRLEEDITKGQMVARYSFSGVDGGAWRVLSRGTTIGYARLDRFEPAAVRRVRLVIEEAVAPPEPIGIKLY
jgi:alpha-L-fucosidase